ncbi:MAG: hypothetical protein AAFR65_02585 [Pseudomonadota bacterium]
MRSTCVAAAVAALSLSAANAADISIEMDFTVGEVNGFLDEASVFEIPEYDVISLVEGDTISVRMVFDSDADRLDITSSGSLIGNFITTLDVSASIFRSFTDGDEEELSPIFGTANAVFDLADPDEVFFTTDFRPLDDPSSPDGAFIQVAPIIEDLELTSDDPVLEGLRLVQDLADAGDPLALATLSFALLATTPEFEAFVIADDQTLTEFGYCDASASGTGSNFCFANLSVDRFAISGVPVADPIPLPGALPLFLAGSALAGFRMRRRKAA